MKDLQNNKLFWVLLGFVAFIVGFVFWVIYFQEDHKAEATWWNPCQYQWCYPSTSPSVTPVPSVEPTVEPTVEPSVSPTETPSVTPTEVPGNPDVSDRRSDGRSDGKCSLPPCVDNRSGVPLYKETINK